MRAAGNDVLPRAVQNIWHAAIPKGFDQLVAFDRRRLSLLLPQIVEYGKDVSRLHFFRPDVLSRCGVARQLALGVALIEIDADHGLCESQSMRLRSNDLRAPMDRG